MTAVANRIEEEMTAILRAWCGTLPAETEQRLRAQMRKNFRRAVDLRRFLLQERPPKMPWASPRMPLNRPKTSLNRFITPLVGRP